MRFLIRLLDLLLIVSLIIAPLSWLFHPLKIFIGPLHATINWGLKPFLIPFVILALRLVADRYMPKFEVGVWRHLLTKKLILSWCMVFFCFLGFEEVLQRSGFEASLPPILIKGVEGSKKSNFTVKDQELLWRFIPGADFNGRLINSMGFPEREIDPVKKAGVTRVICMGDSCTGQGIPPYAGFLHGLLTTNPPNAKVWESFCMGVHGYSSTQGWRLFQTRVPELNPDYVSLYYGWNDHWRARGTDSSRMAVSMNSFSGKAYEVLRHKLFFQFMMHVANKNKNPQVAKHQEFYLRVPPDEYVANLKVFAKGIRDIGATPIFITAPRAKKLTEMLVVNNQAENLEVVTALHDEYVNLTRQVAEEENVPLLDLARIFEEEEKLTLMSGDGIHFRREGRKEIARQLYSLISALESKTVPID